jgi:RNA polymerase sigma-70 factor (ECF subfamily)
MVAAETDRQLLKRHVKRGDLVAFDQLVERHQAELLRLAASFARDVHAAQDLVQETFIALARSAERVLASSGRKDDGSIRGWLLLVLRNLAIDRYRAERPLRNEAAPECLTVVAVADADSDALLWAAVDSLGPLQRAAVVLRYREDLSYRAIAEVLGKSVSHVGVLLHQALAQLRELRALREEVLP